MAEYNSMDEYLEARIKFLESRDVLPIEKACIQFALKELRMALDFYETPKMVCDGNSCKMEYVK